MAWLSTRRLALVGVLLGSSLALSACSSSGALKDARAACVQVEKALTSFKASQAPGLAPEEVAALKSQAQDELIRALASGGRANSGDGSFGALMTNIQEASRVPIELLVPALTRQCEVVRSNTPYLGR